MNIGLLHIIDASDILSHLHLTKMFQMSGEQWLSANHFILLLTDICTGLKGLWGASTR